MPTCPSTTRPVAPTNPNYDPVNYYNYAVEMAAGSTGGSIWIYDPGFCAGALQTGLGDTWIGSKVPISSFYDLYDTMGTPYDLTDDTLVPGFSSGNTFKNQDGSDPALSGSGGSGIGGCDAYHLGWYQLGTSTLAGGAAGHAYRLHTTTTDPSSATAQLTGQRPERVGTVRQGHERDGPEDLRDRRDGDVHAAAELGSSSEFYLAQIEAAHAGKTMEVRLFDRRRHEPGRQHPDPDPDVRRLERDQLQLHGRQGHDQQWRDELQLVRRHERVERHHLSKRGEPVQRLLDHHPDPDPDDVHRAAESAGGRSATT